MLKSMHETAQSAVVYLLPHEVELMNGRFRTLEEKHIEIVDVFADAMEQSSETWHDNAPADAARDAATVLSWEARQLVTIAKNYEVVDYPPIDSHQVAIGSRVRLSVNGSSPFSIDIVGASLLGRNALVGDGEEIEQVTYNAPLATLVLGHPEGKSFEGELNGKTVSIVLLGVDQTAQRTSPPQTL